MDRKELEAWLETRPREDAILIAQRAALRVFPLYGCRTDLSATKVLRAVQVSGASRHFNSIEVRVASLSAAAMAMSDAPVRERRTASRADSPAVATAVASSALATISSSPAELLTVGRRGVPVIAAASVANSVWAEVIEDVGVIEADGLDALLVTRLWLNAEPETIRNAYAPTLTNLTLETGEENSFWHRWLEGAHIGNWLDWDLQRRVALIPDELWDAGPKAVIAAIHEIEREMAGNRSVDPVEYELTVLPPSAAEAVARFKRAVAEHHEDIPATLDALMTFVGKEIDRLQFRNEPYSTPEEEAEAQRQIRVLNTICATLQKLRDTIPANGVLTDAAAERGEKLTRLFIRHFKEWPRKTAEDIVDSTCRAALVGLTATVAPMIGVPVSIAVGAGVVLFGGKKVADGLKAVKDIAP